MIPKGKPGVKSEIVLCDGQRFPSIDAFSKACGITYNAVFRRMRYHGQDPDSIAREKGILKLAAE